MNSELYKESTELPRIGDAHFNHVETDVLVEGEEDDFGQTVIVPRSVDQKQPTQETKLRGQRKKGGEGRGGEGRGGEGRGGEGREEEEGWKGGREWAIPTCTCTSMMYMYII